jgi:hypothetical protein
MNTTQSISTLLLALANDATRERISLGDIVQAMQDRAHAALILLLAMPNVVPAPPGTSTVLGVPLVLLSTQLMLGRPARLPHAMTGRSLPRSHFATTVRRVSPWLDRAESMLRPRLPPLTGPPAARWVGGLCLLLSATLALPIPFGNMLPALAICLMALGLLERDGLWVLCGGLASALAMGLVGGVVYGLARGAWEVVERVGG